ncbi:MAG: EamA family transporter [Desulfuromonadaceae bacterium]|nr:EamA family transporter [Desulfuromonadaceae bacterium]
MSYVALGFIIFSALMHAWWNVLVKRSSDKTVFIWWMFVASGLLFQPLVYGMPQDFPVPTIKVWLAATAAALCFVLYHLFNGRAFREGDLSLTYPLSQTSTLYVPLWGVLLLGERLSVWGGVGILCIIAGAYTVQLPNLSLAQLLRPFYNLRQKSVQSALAAGFIYSVGSVLDKTGVSCYPPLHFTYLLVMIMLLMMSANLCRSRFRGRILTVWQRNRNLILWSGPVMLGSFVSFRYGLSLAPVSYAVPVRQVSLLFGVLTGVLFLGESSGRMRFAGALLIVGGVFLIRLGG